MIQSNSFQLKLPESSQVGVKTGPKSAELPTPKVLKVIAVYSYRSIPVARRLEALSIPGEGPEVIAKNFTSEPDVLELGSSATVTEALF